ncbi:MAG: PHB depolymerase family esterase, partial [Bacteroidota bacterium]
TSGEELPLVFNYHGYTSTALQQAWLSEMNFVADTGNFIVVYPQGKIVEVTTQLPPLFPPAGPGWNVEEILESENDDLGFFDAMVEAIDSDFGVDSSRIYSTGFSNGGLMSGFLACKRPGVVAAVAHVSGIGNCARDSVVPTLIIHGTTDPALLYQGSTASTSPHVFSAFESLAAANGCGTAIDSADVADLDPDDNTSTKVFTVPGCEPEAEVTHYRINDGDHWWPDGPGIPPLFTGLAGSKLSRDFNGSRTIWEFFLRHRKAMTTNLRTPLEPFGYGLYPNPSAGRVTLKLELPQTAPVRAVLLNSLGQPVANLVAETLPAGSHTFTLAGDQLPAGLYQCRIAVSDHIKTLSVILQ